jgi:hypothetical protein
MALGCDADGRGRSSSGCALCDMVSKWLLPGWLPFPRLVRPAYPDFDRVSESVTSSGVLAANSHTSVTRPVKMA